MELELGLKLTRVADEFSSADFLLAKDRGGPLFISTESETMFLLTAHLRGYRKQNIKIEINEDGTRIIIGGEKLVQETLVVGWKLQKKETEKREFKKVFKIPQGVILDKIRAKFDEDESMLTISIPKKEKGIRGISIEEMKEQEIARECSGSLQIVPDDIAEGENKPPQKQDEKEADYAEGSDLSEENTVKVPETASVQEPEETTESNVANPEETPKEKVHYYVQEEEKMKETQQDLNGRPQKAPSGQDLVETDTVEDMKNFPGEGCGEATAKAAMEEAAKSESGMQGEELKKKPIGQSTEEEMGGGERDKCPHSGQEIAEDQHENDQHDLKGNDIQEDEDEGSALVEPTDKAQSQECMPPCPQEKRGRCKLCTPILAGSALLLSLVVFVIHFIRTKSQTGKKKD